MVVLLAAAGMSGVLMDSADASFTGTKKLRTFTIGSLDTEQFFFVLEFNPAEGENFERYFFRVQGATGDIPVSASALHIQVRPVDGINPASPEVICEGTLSETAGFHVSKMCDEVRAGHHYRIDTRSTVPTQLHLYGFNPISPPQGGNGAQPLCWVDLC